MFFTRGAVMESRVSLEVNIPRIPGLINPTSREAEACTPGVLVKISTVNPKANDRNNSRERGVSKGSRTINRI